MGQGWVGIRRVGCIAAVAALSISLNTDFHAPPRFDGAGYAVLAQALATGQGYREIDHPDAPRHAHFPPGYPLALAGVRRVWRDGWIAPAHAFSVLATVTAVVAATAWFHRQYPSGVATMLGLALGVNWTWGRTGGAIQSEPLFLALGQLALLVATRARGCTSGWRGVGLGMLLAASVLTRHVGLTLAAAVLLDGFLDRHRHRPRSWGISALTVVVLVLPWMGWLAAVGQPTQAGLLRGDGLAGRLISQAVFYTQRLPDVVVGPVVEIGTVIHRRAGLAIAVNLGAAVMATVLALGLMRALRTPRRRLAALSVALTLALLLVWPFTEAGRFLIPLVPSLLILTVEGLATIARRLPGLRPARARRWAAGMVLVMSIPYPLYALMTDRAGAQRRTHADFDAACGWLARAATRPGPVLTRHPGEVFGQTGRHALAPAAGDDDLAAVDRLVDRYRIAYLLIDGDRYAGAKQGPAAAYARRHPGRVRVVWSRGGVAIAEVAPGDAPQRVEPSNRSRL